MLLCCGICMEKTTFHTEKRMNTIMKFYENVKSEEGKTIIHPFFYIRCSDYISVAIATVTLS